MYTAEPSNKENCTFSKGAFGPCALHRLHPARPFFSSDIFHPTRQWTTQWRRAERAAKGSLVLVPKGPKASFSRQVLLLWWEWLGTNPSFPWQLYTYTYTYINLYVYNQIYIYIYICI